MTPFGPGVRETGEDGSGYLILIHRRKIGISRLSVLFNEAKSLKLIHRIRIAWMRRGCVTLFHFVPK